MTTFLYDDDKWFAKKSLVIDLPDVNPDNWYVVQDERYRPDKDSYIENKFREEWPNVDIKGIEQVYKLASRSTSINIWLAGANAEYSKVANIPTFYKDLVSGDEFKSASDVLTNVGKTESERALKLQEAARTYEANCKKINSEADLLIKNKVSGNKLAQILMIRSNMLPINLSLAIDNFTPIDAEGAPDTRAYARELLVKFKTSLIKHLRDDKEFVPMSFIDTLNDQKPKKI